MTATEITSLAFAVAYAVASIIANRYPNTKFGKVCAIVALVTKHELTPKADKESK